ncbi:MAG: peptidylprolyl isomerase [Clostridia bacterium]
MSKKKNPSKNTSKKPVVKEEVVELKEEKKATEDVSKKEEKEAKNETKKEVKNIEKKEEKKNEKKVEKSEAKKEEKSVTDEKAMTKKMKNKVNDKVVIYSIVAGVIVIAFAIFGFYFYKSNMKSVAKFDGGKLSTSDYTVYYKTFAPMLEYYGYPASIIPEQIANKAAVDQIILKMAKDAKVTLSDEDKKKVDETFNDKDKVKQFQEQGIDIAKLRDLYSNDYIITAYIEKLKKEANNDQVIAYIKSVAGEKADMNEYNTRHILFKTADATGAPLAEDKKAEVKAKAEEILKKALAGENFESLAKANTEDTGTKESGGKFSMYMDDKVMKEYAEAVKSLRPGEIKSVLVETEAGYHIILLESVVENGRVNNDAEREAFVDQDINKLNETKHLEVDKDALNKLVKTITGKDPAAENKTPEGGNSNGTTNTTPETTTPENTGSQQVTVPAQ